MVGQPTPAEVDDRVRATLASPDVQNLIAHFRGKFSNVPEDDAESAAHEAVWQACLRHKDGLQKFTTSLYCYLRWRHLDAAGRAKNEGAWSFRPLKKRMKASACRSADLSDALHLLSTHKDGWMVRAYYLDGSSIEEIAVAAGLGRYETKARMEAAHRAARSAAGVL